jgi:tetratricopeptide (TPR) repeat protein
LWQIQRRYFEDQGVEAWYKNVVPHYITSSPYIAQAYARVALGYLRDVQAWLAPDEPVYMLELGAGSGRFAFHFLRKFLPLLAASPLAGLKICYVLTDLPARNVDFWQAHPAFQQWVAEGLVDFAQWDATAGSEISLRVSGKTLAPGSLANPLILAANYFFDSLPQDVFRVEGGRLQECLVTLTSPQPEPDPTNPEVLKRVSIRFDSQPCRQAYYGDAELDALLDHYRAQLSRSYLIFPHEGIRCLRALAGLSGGRALLLSGDSGVRSLEEWEGRGAPDVRIHGSFSMHVNYHAIGMYTLTRGGQYDATAHRPSYLTVCACVLGERAGGWPETRLAYTEAVERGGPDDFFLLKNGIEKHYAAYTLEELLAYLRISGWDGRLFLDCYLALLEKAPQAGMAAQAALAQAIDEIWKNYYHLGEERDLPFEAGVLLYKLDRLGEAQAFFERSLALYGRSPSTLYNVAMVLARRGRTGQASARVKEALAIEPDFGPARALLAQLKRKRGPQIP